MAWSWGGATSGAMGGASLAAPMGPAGALGGGIIGGVLGGFTGGGDEGVEGQQPSWQVVNLPTYDFTEPRLRSMSDFVQNQFDSLGRGEMPVWLKNFLYGGPVSTAGGATTSVPGMWNTMNRELETTYYGRPGERYGVLPTALSSAAITGAGSGTANRAVSRKLSEYADMASKIDEFISNLGMTGTLDTMKTAGTIGVSIPQGPPAVVVGPYGGYGGTSAADNTGMISSLMSGVSGLASALTNKPSKSSTAASPWYAASSLTPDISGIGWSGVRNTSPSQSQVEANSLINALQSQLVNTNRTMSQYY